MTNTKTRYSLLFISMFIVAAMYLVTVSPLMSSEKPGQIFKPDDMKIVEQGKLLYAENCASCHGANLEGETPNWRSPGPDGKLPAPPHDQAGHTWHHTDELLFNLTKYGLAEAAGLKDYESNMPIYKDILTDDEIIAVMSFIKSTWPEDIRNHHDQINVANSPAQ